MIKDHIVRIELAGLPDATSDQTLKAFKILLLASVQQACREQRKREKSSQSLEQNMITFMEIVFNSALTSGAFDRAEVFAEATDDLCSSLGLFGIKPFDHKRKNS